jgi:hypothetical protein
MRRVPRTSPNVVQWRNVREMHGQLTSQSAHEIAHGPFDRLSAILSQWIPSRRYCRADGRRRIRAGSGHRRLKALAHYLVGLRTLRIAWQSVVWNRLP